MKTLERGITKIGLLFCLLLILVGVLLGGQVIRFYYSYYDLLGLMEAQAAKASVINDEQMRYTITKRIKELEIPIEDPEAELNIERTASEISISITYSEVLFIDLGEGREYDLWEFQFNPKAEGTL